MSASSPAGPLRALLVGTNTAGVFSGVASGSSHGPIEIGSYQNLTLYVVASAALSAGTVIIEERDQPQDAPSVIDTITLATPFVSAGGTYAYHVGGPGGSFAYGQISARIGTSVVGGTVYVVLRAN